eukprot:1944497-Rhodomonas_salina.1
MSSEKIACDLRYQQRDPVQLLSGPSQYSPSQDHTISVLSQHNPSPYYRTARVCQYRTARSSTRPKQVLGADREECVFISVAPVARRCSHTLSQYPGTAHCVTEAAAYAIPVPHTAEPTRRHIASPGCPAPVGPGRSICYLSTGRSRYRIDPYLRAKRSERSLSQYRTSHTAHGCLAQEWTHHLSKINSHFSTGHPPSAVPNILYATVQGLGCLYQHVLDAVHLALLRPCTAQHQSMNCRVLPQCQSMECCSNTP